MTLPIRTGPSNAKCWLRLNDHFDDPVHQFKLLRGAGSEESVDSFSDVAWTFLSFEEKEDIRWKF